MGNREIVGSDLFQCAGKHYLIITDYYLCYPEVYLLRSEEAEDVIVATKDVFARHGVPVTLISDNGPQFSARNIRGLQKNGNFHMLHQALITLSQMALQNHQ